MDDEAEIRSNPTPARPREGGLIPQPHGGAIRPGYNGGGFKKHRRIALKLLNEGLPEAVERVMQMVRSEDERVAIMAGIQVMDRTLGKPSDVPQAGDATGGALDLSLLTAGERSRLAHALASVRELRALIESRAARAAGPVIEAVAEPPEEPSP